MADALHTPGVVSAAEARLDDAGLIAVQGPTALDARTGVLVGPGTTALVTGTSDTAPMAYLIAPHHWVTNRGVNTDGVYRGALESATRATTTAAPGTGSRIDVIYAKQGDATSTISADGTTAPVYGCVQGTSTTGTPTKPSIPVGAIELATGTVSAGATNTNDGTKVLITNTARQTAARGARIPVRSQAERDALTAFLGLEVYRLDTGQVQLCTSISPTTWATAYDPAPAPPMSGEYSGPANGVVSAVLTNLPSMTVKRQVGGLATTFGANGAVTLPSGVWAISWDIQLTGGALFNGRSFVQVSGFDFQTFAARRSIGSAGEDTAGGVVYGSLAAQTQLTLQFLVTANTSPFNCNHFLRVHRLAAAS